MDPVNPDAFDQYNRLTKVETKFDGTMPENSGESSDPRLVKTAVTAMHDFSLASTLPSAASRAISSPDLYSRLERLRYTLSLTCLAVFAWLCYSLYKKAMFNGTGIKEIISKAIKMKNFQNGPSFTLQESIDNTNNDLCKGLRSITYKAG